MANMTIDTMSKTNDQSVLDRFNTRQPGLDSEAIDSSSMASLHHMNTGITHPDGL